MERLEVLRNKLGELLSPAVVTIIAAVGLLALLGTQLAPLTIGTPDPHSVVPNTRVAATDPDLQISKGVLYHHEKPFSGWLIERYDNQMVKRITMYFKGQKHGLDNGWYPSGKQQFERNYVMGKKQGLHKGWFEDGSEKFSYEFTDDRHNSSATESYANGPVARDSNDTAGAETSRQHMRTANRKVKSNYVIRSGRRYGYIGMKPCSGQAPINTSESGNG